MQAGDVAVIRASNEPVLVLATLDASGTLLVRCGEEEFAVQGEDLVTLVERAAGCGCCG